MLGWFLPAWSACNFVPAAHSLLQWLQQQGRRQQNPAVKALPLITFIPQVELHILQEDLLSSLMHLHYRSGSMNWRQISEQEEIAGS